MNKVINFGCRLNNFEGKKIEELLRRIEILQTENQSLIIKSTENKKNE